MKGILSCCLLLIFAGVSFASGLPKTDNIKAVYNKYKNKTVVKGEFETTAEYKKRLADQSSDKSPSYVFLVNKDSLKITYDADDKRLDITPTVEDTSSVRINESSKKTITLSRYENPARKVIGSNAFGAKTVITKYSGEHYGIVISNYDEFSNAVQDKFSYILEPSEARKLKDSFALLLTAKPVFENESYTFDSAHLSEATFTSPIEIFYPTYFVYCRVVEISVINTKTGKVYSRIDPVAEYRKKIAEELQRLKQLEAEEKQRAEERKKHMTQGELAFEKAKEQWMEEKRKANSPTSTEPFDFEKAKQQWLEEKIRAREGR